MGQVHPQAPRLKVGDVFTIPVDGDRVGVGQIVAALSPGHYYFAVFEGVHRSDAVTEMGDVPQEGIVFLVRSMDALLYHGIWKVIDNQQVDESRINWPIYKVATAPDEFVVIDHTDEVKRSATPEEVEALPYCKVVAPIRVQDALQALHGQRDWDPDYDELLHDDTPERL
jgi:hypothetical protein